MNHVETNEVVAILKALEILRDGPPPGMTFRQAMAILERRVLEAAIERNGGRTSQTARELGMSREGLFQARKRLGMAVRKGGPVPVPADWRERLRG